MGKTDTIMLFLWLLAIPVAGQIVTVKSTFGKDSVSLGEQFIYSITVESENEVMVGLPTYTDTLSKQIEILESSGTDTIYIDNKRRITKKFLVTSFEPGWNTIPPQPVTFTSGELRDTVYTTALLLTVLSPEVDTTQAIKPIKPPVYTPVSLAEIMPWAFLGAGGFLLLTLIAALIWIYIQKQKNPEVFASKPMEPAHMVALRELELLRKENLPGNGMVKEYYSRLTQIIRVYIASHFSIHAMESTSSEILEAFAIQFGGDHQLIESLNKLLMLADLVKFAKEDPTREENDYHLEKAVDFVVKTYSMFATEDENEQGDMEEKSHVERLKLEENHG
ncbi:MAG: hypothetical protein WD578_12145 [Bacteroidales bacterium]